MRLRRRRTTQERPEGNPGLRDAQRAQAAAEGGLAATARRTPEIEEVVGKLRRLRESNHFSERIVEMLRGSSGPPGEWHRHA